MRTVTVAPCILPPSVADALSRIRVERGREGRIGRPRHCPDPPLPDERRRLVRPFACSFGGMITDDLVRGDTPSSLQFSNLTFSDWTGTSLRNTSTSPIL